MSAVSWKGMHSGKSALLPLHNLKWHVSVLLANSFGISTLKEHISSWMVVPVKFAFAPLLLLDISYLSRHLEPKKVFFTVFSISIGIEFSCLLDTNAPYSRFLYVSYLDVYHKRFTTDLPSLEGLPPIQRYLRIFSSNSGLNGSIY